MVQLPAYLDSKCMEGDFGGICCGPCDEAIKQNPETGRWFITIGHAGFNSAANNGRGYATKGAAYKSHRYYGNW